MYYRFLISEYLQSGAMKKQNVAKTIACVFVFVSTCIISTSDYYIDAADLPTPMVMQMTTIPAHKSPDVLGFCMQSQW